MIDQLSIIFIFRVSLIRLAVLNFSKSYITNDKNFIRFHYLLITFILRIYFLVLSPNMVSILLGWDGLGLRSYLLVIYYDNYKAYNSGIITAITNRLGDSLILLRIGYLLRTGNWNLYYYSNKIFILWIVIIIILAACTKRAQIPFSAWLPAAMAAPTPVSSLVHSSTLVTAGVYLLIRHNNFFFLNNTIVHIIIIGTLTIVMARIRALYETDLKKMVALSTLRQLGAIFLSLGLGGFLIRYFHLLTHAFFKALLFLCTGAIIHRRKDYQDLRITGNRINSLPSVNSFILVSRFSLMGLPFISAFFSKEIILEYILLKNFNFFIYVLIIISVTLTAIYRFRFILLIFSFWNLNNILTLKSEKEWFILKRIMILFLPASLRGSWLYLYLFNNFKLRESIIFFKILILFLILIRAVYLLTQTHKKITWINFLWGLSGIWFLPFIRAQIPSVFIIYNRWWIFKIIDRGTIKFNAAYFSSIKITKISTISLKIIYKLLFLVIIWVLIIIIIYICK